MSLLLGMFDTFHNTIFKSETFSDLTKAAPDRRHGGEGLEGSAAARTTTGTRQAEPDSAPCPSSEEHQAEKMEIS